MSAAPANRAVLFVGRVYCDLIFSDVPRPPSMGTEVYAGGFAMDAGGGALISAAYCAALGRAAFLAAYLPAPPFAGIVAKTAGALGIDLSMSRAAGPGEAPQLTVVMAGSRDRAFLTHRAGPGAVLPPAAALAERGIGHLHVGELRTLIDHPDLIGLAREAGLTLSLDCSWEDAVAAEAGALIAQVDLFLPNEEEVRHLERLGIDPFGAGATVVKRGVRGARWHDGARQVSRRTRAVAVRDTTGAGDAFNAGFLNRWLDKAPVEACLDAGNRCGAVAVGHAGGCGGALAMTGQNSPDARSRVLSK